MSYDNCHFNKYKDNSYQNPDLIFMDKRLRKFKKGSENLLLEGVAQWHLQRKP